MIGSAAGKESRRSVASLALLSAWMLLAVLLAAAAAYVYWPELEPQIAVLTETTPAGEELAEVDVEPSPPVPPITDAATEGQETTASDELGSELDLAGPQSAPLPELESEAAPTPPGDRESGESELRTARQPPAGEVAETGSMAAEPSSENRAGGPQAVPPAQETQTAALPAAPEATPPAPAPPVVPAWQRFARSFIPPDERPLIAIVITGLGLNGPRTLQAIEQLPPEISLSFSPYAKQTEEFMRTARAFGHEVLIDLPMEPATRDDPGTMALLTSARPDDNLERLGLVLGRGRDYVGVVGTLGSRFVGDTQALTPVLSELGRRGLLYVDNRPVDTPHAARLAVTLGLPVAINDRSLDARMAATPAVDASLAQVERIARERGTAVALGQPNPTTLAFLVEWARTLPGKGLALAPVTAVANSQSPQ
ncbi:divergent polysaccharide deacetylase family protein [Algihabitans albus]|uniref:divergent polysaccharide deacetylase family protein n=1 Tax=Algihabitans albus TaxID=2164067 RepID=UPI000E5D2589|nr:divergent polysaccharide deacetylase family protein [Algihabitans albus]